jgi:cleavage stimulation factor subunit 3
MILQSAKKLYENILGASTNSLAHIQYLRFLRRAEGVEAARKYFLDARKSPSCTYHVYIAFATMAFCIDKEPKVYFLTHYVVVYMLFRTAFVL